MLGRHGANSSVEDGVDRREVENKRRNPVGRLHVASRWWNDEDLAAGVEGQ